MRVQKTWILPDGQQEGQGNHWIQAQQRNPVDDRAPEIFNQSELRSEDHQLPPSSLFQKPWIIFGRGRGITHLGDHTRGPFNI